jgi:hypothetical protein
MTATGSRSGWKLLGRAASMDGEEGAERACSFVIGRSFRQATGVHRSSFLTFECGRNQGCKKKRDE